jgi:hypothetical protein
MKIRFQSGPAVLALAVIAGFALAPTAQAKVTKMHFDLSGPAETPPTDSKGTGHGTVTYDDKTMELKWHITWSGLGSDATASHFHGPAKPGTPAGVVLPTRSPGGLTSPLIGSATLSEEQAKQLLAGDWYWNIHTKDHPPGELRGQVVPDGAGKAKKAADKP